MKTICTGMFTIMLVLLFRPVGAQTEDAFPSYIEQCFNNYFNFNPQEKIYLHTDLLCRRKYLVQSLLRRCQLSYPDPIK